MTIQIRNPQTGETLEVAQDQFDQVYSGQGYERVDDQKGLDDMTRDELNARATDAGVENPASLPNKDAVIKEIEDAEQARD